jgi:hypothetical protein
MVMCPYFGLMIVFSKVFASHEYCLYPKKAWCNDISHSVFCKDIAVYRTFWLTRFVYIVLYVLLSGAVAFVSVLCID